MSYISTKVFINRRNPLKIHSAALTIIDNYYWSFLRPKVNFNLLIPFSLRDDLLMRVYVGSIIVKPNAVNT